MTGNVGAPVAVAALVNRNETVALIATVAANFRVQFPFAVQ